MAARLLMVAALSELTVEANIPLGPDRISGPSGAYRGRVAVGSWAEFRCGSCGHEVMVSGRDDVGFFVNTTTVLCEDCEQLYDVVTFRRPEGAGWATPCTETSSKLP